MKKIIVATIVLIFCAAGLHFYQNHQRELRLQSALTELNNTSSWITKMRLTYPPESEPIKGWKIIVDDTDNVFSRLGFQSEDIILQLGDVSTREKPIDFGLFLKILKEDPKALVSRAGKETWIKF